MNFKQSDLEELLQIQAEFDARIDTHNIEDTKTAYFIEFTEWFNTIEPFKNWKQQKGKAREVQLAELADMLAFGLSAYLQAPAGGRKHSVKNMSPTISMAIDLVVPGKQLFDLDFIGQIHKQVEDENFNVMLQLPFMIAADLYTIPELIDAYKTKMQVNHERQDSGY